MRIELHCHSHHSHGTKLPIEGIPSPREIVKRAERIGLGGVAILDHNSFRAFREGRAEARRRGILLIPGEEMTSGKGHVLGIGISEFIPGGLSLEETIERIHEQGGLAIAPHPFDVKGDGIGEGFRKCDAVEVFSSMNLDRFSNFLAEKKAGSMPRTAGSDAHTLEMLGNSVNIIDADSVDSVLREIRKGRVSYLRGYARAGQIRRWAYQRLSGSREIAVEYVNGNYSPLKRWVSLRLMDRFLENQGGVFSFLAKFGISCSCGYGAVKALQRL